MTEIQFEVLKKLVFDSYGKCKYEKALDLAKLAAETFPEKMPQTSYWLACLYSKLEMRSRAISVIKEAIDKKIWWSPNRLLSDEDLFPLHPLDHFQYLVRVCGDMEEKARLKARPELLLYTPKHYTSEGAYPLLISLHWQNGNALEYAEAWRKSRYLEDYILAFPQSSQITAVNEFHWDDEILAEREIQQCYDKILNQYKINRDKMIITGTSQGGKIAIQTALKNKQQYYKGFIAIIPIISKEEINELLPLINAANLRGIRGCIIVGQQDIHYPNTMKLYQTFKIANFPCKLIEINTVGHQLPNDFLKKFKIGISYIL